MEIFLYYFQELKPRYWFAAHMHCSFSALVPHPNNNEDAENDDFEPTRFLALDKPISGRHFLQVLEFDVDENASMCLSYDPVWLAILKATDAFTSTNKAKTYMPSHHTRNERWDFRPTEEELNEVKELFGDNFVIPMNFQMTAEPHCSQEGPVAEELYYRNPQTTEFCNKLGIKDLNEMLCALSMQGLGVPYYLRQQSSKPENDVSVTDRSEVIVFFFVCFKKVLKFCSFSF
ncbi:unnamed protein product [Gongylonema pulchrum]|uniref:DBR1 domain-containing protein n=1 Tax=Gongylonema pulchrum TaxID=637853 RepID=A0A183D655_9BILA|nr:unnamed protein product [Gongylonema pulchrum]